MEGERQNASNDDSAPGRTCNTCQRHLTQDCYSTAQVAECVDCVQRERRFAKRAGALGGEFSAMAASAAPRQVTDTLRDAVNQCGKCHKRLRHPAVSRSVAAAGEEKGEGECFCEILKRCSACGLASYCSRECQREDWAEHRPFCRANHKPGIEQLACDAARASDIQTEKANGLVGDKFGEIQKECQEKLSAELQAAVHGTYTIRPSSHVRLAPASDPRFDGGSRGIEGADMRQLEKYEVAWWHTDVASGMKYSGSHHFKYVGADHRDGGNPHACDLPGEVAAARNVANPSSEKYSEGGIHYLLGIPRTFWSMVVNYHCADSPLPFGCHRGAVTNCPSAMLSVQDWRRWKLCYDKIFTDALRDPNAVRCMFVDTPIGCRARNCHFRHDGDDH